MDTLLGFRSFNFRFTEAFTFLFTLDVAVIVTLPVFFPFTVPLLDTEAIFVLLDLYVTLLLAFFGLILFTEIFVVPFTSITLLETDDVTVSFFGFTVAACASTDATPADVTVTATAAITASAFWILPLIILPPFFVQVVFFHYSGLLIF